MCAQCKDSPKATVLACLPLAAPVGLSSLLILTLCGSERVLVVSTEPLDVTGVGTTDRGQTVGLIVLTLISQWPGLGFAGLLRIAAPLACLPTCPHADLSTCSPARLHAMPASIPVYLPAYMLACLHACMLDRMLACVPPLAVFFVA